MSKKRNKSPANNAANNNKWEQNIVSAELNEGEWSYSLSYLVEDIVEDKETIEYIKLGMLTGLRRKFSLLNLERLLELVGEYGGAKTKKGKDAPLNFEVCECAKAYLDRGEAIPASIIARLIKWMMLTSKSEDAKVKLEGGKKVEGKGPKSKKTNEKPDVSKSAAGKKGAQAAGKKSPEPPSVKGDTKLRKRGDPDPDIQYIDDEPDDGSARYFVVTGAPDSSIIVALADIGCIVTSVVKVTRDIHIPHQEVDQDEENAAEESANSQKGDEIEEAKMKETVALKTFWDNLTGILNENQHLVNTPIVTLVAKHLMFPVDKEDLEQTRVCAMELFESVAVLKYDLLDLRRQWKNYLEKGKIFELPMRTKEELKPETAAVESAREEKVPSDEAQTKAGSSGGNSFVSVEMDYYHFLLQDVAIEDTSVYLQMSAMLDQVEVTCGDKTTDWDKPKLSQQNNFSEEAAQILDGMIDKLYLSKEDLKELREKLQLNNSNKAEKEKLKNEAPVHALDGISLRDAVITSRNVGKDGSMIRELRMLITSFKKIDILGHIAVEDSVARRRAARLQELMKYMENTTLSNIEINYAIKLFILENLVLSGTDENGIMRVNDEDGVFPKNANQMWDDPFMIMEDVGQSITDEEHNCPTMKVDMFEDSCDSAREESPESRKSSSQRSTEGILRTSPSGNRSTRRKSSVHFVEVEKNEFSDFVTEGELDVAGMLMDEQDESLQVILLDYLYNVQKRSFTEWCFEEFYEPHVMLQILQGAFYKLPFLDIYSERKTDGKIVILHNPFQEKLRYNHQPWNQWLHSNVGFRNYLDFISDKIKDWTREEEAIYQAVLLNKELKESEKPNEEEIPVDKPKKGAEKAVKGKPPKSRSRSTSRSPSDDGHVSKELSFVLPGSLKAQKMEQDKILKAKEEEERKKEEKRSLSAQKKAEKDAPKDKTKRPSSKTSNKSKSKRSVIEDPQDQAELVDNELIKLDTENYWPFVGYDLGDNLAHFSGEVAHLFPSDGCTIRINKTQKLLDSTSIRVSIITPQSHVLSLHIVDPLLGNCEQMDNIQKVLDQFQSQGSVSRYGASTCVFNDGLCLAASNYGYSGSSEKKEGVAVTSQLPEAADNQSHGSEEIAGEKKMNSFHESAVTEANRRSFICSSTQRNNVDLKDIQNIILTSPNGVQVRVGYDMDEVNLERRLLLLLTKCEPHTSGGHKKDKFQTPKELGRYILSDGRVVSVMNNETIKIMFPDGTVAIASLLIESTVVREEESEETKIEKANVRETPSQKKKKQPKMPSIDQPPLAESNLIDEHKEIINKTRTWVITNPNGEKYETKADLNVFDIPEPSSKLQNKVAEEEVANSVEDQEPSSSLPDLPPLKRYLQSPHLKESLLISCATDPATGETLVTRSDGTLLLTTQEAGIFLSEHVDRTRFTKYFILEKSVHSKDHQDDPEEPKVTEIIQIESEHYPMVTIDRTNGKMETRVGSMGSLLSISDGSHCYKHSDGTEIEYRPDGEMIFTAAGNSQMSYLQPYGSSSYVLNTTSNIICEMLDADGTEFVVDVAGNYEVKRNEKDAEQCRESGEDMPTKPTSAISGASRANGDFKEASIRKFDQHAPRVFFLSQDGSGSELLRYRDIVDTIVSAETAKDHFQYKESVQNHPHIIGHTIMHPTVNTKPWKYDYSRKTVLPKGLTCRDMKTFPANETIKEGPLFGMSMGKGLSITTNPFEVGVDKKAPANTKGVSSSDSLQFRQFYHYPLITDEVRNRFSIELVEYNKSVLRRRQKYKDLQIVDDQSQEEQNLAEEIKSKYASMRTISGQAINDAVQSLADSAFSPKLVNEDAPTHLRPCVENSSKPNKKRLEILLEKERIDKEKEIENKKSLRNKYVPSYFTSIYGNDFLINQAVDLQTLNKSMKLFPLSREATERKDVVDAEPLSESSAYSSGVDVEKPSDACATKHSSTITQLTSKETTDHQSVILKKETKYVYYDSSLIIPNLPKRMPVSTNLPLPRYLFSERPSVEQNIKQATVEDPVRRRQLTSSVVGGPVIGQLFQRQCRGLNVLPSRIDTGLLKEGERYTFKIKMINTGPESSYFKIKQPPSASGIWVEFLPGPIAAGLSRQITVHVYAIAKSVESNDSQVYVIEQVLTIVTDTDILEIPVVGRVMTAQRFDTIYPPGKLAEGGLVEDVESLQPILTESKRLSVELVQV